MGFPKLRRKCNFSNLFSRILRIFRKFLKVFNKKCPGVYNILFESNQKYIFLKILLCYFYGLFLGYLFWEFIILHIGFSFKLTYMVLCILMILLGMFFSHFVVDLNKILNFFYIQRNWMCFFNKSTLYLFVKLAWIYWKSWKKFYESCSFCFYHNW